jgi:hypothetical protein
MKANSNVIELFMFPSNSHVPRSGSSRSRSSRSSRSSGPRAQRSRLSGRLASEYVDDIRRRAVRDGRAMIRVRYTDTGELSTAAVCPGCWNDPERRRALLVRLKKMKVEVVSPQDGPDGTYLEGEAHLRDCPYRHKKDAWEKFRNQMRSRNVRRPST